MVKKFFNLLFHRTFFIAVAILIQIVVLVTVIWRFNNQFVYFYMFTSLLSAAVVLHIISKNSNPSYKIAWIVPIMLFPIFGGLFYVLFGSNKMSRNIKKKMNKIKDKFADTLNSDSLIDELRTNNEVAMVQSRYIFNASYCPPYNNTYTEYLPLGEIKFERLKEELSKAEHYIFMEYFIIEEGQMWDSILEILRTKAQQGVDVRLIYDDIGCLFTLPYGYDKKLRDMGIKCSIFNPFRPILSIQVNNRDHRKITVIDGHTAFTGGINLADEYINAYAKHGHWKDSAVLLKGDAVYSLTVMFLTMWDYINGTDENYLDFMPTVFQKDMFLHEGYVQPFNDNPLDEEPVGQTVYLNLITKAKRYVYINTPYLIIDNEMTNALIAAAKGGVDVKIVTPHVADKRFVHFVTRSSYEALINAGVEIYEYTPGFMHSKTFVVDDEYCVIGTINLDYRSLFLHFECGVWMYKTESVLQLKNDFLKTLSLCKRIAAEEYTELSMTKRILRALLSAFAPLM